MTQAPSSTLPSELFHVAGPFYFQLTSNFSNRYPELSKIKLGFFHIARRLLSYSNSYFLLNRVVTFSSVHHLTLHFPSNLGGDDETKVYYIGLKGEFTKVLLPTSHFFHLSIISTNILHIYKYLISSLSLFL